MKLSEKIHGALAERMLSKHHRVRTALLKLWTTEVAQLEVDNEALREQVKRGYTYIFPGWIKKFLGE